MNIEEAAKAAGILPERDETFGKVYEVELQQLAAFAKIIRNQTLEEAAVMCNQSDEDGEGPDCWDWHAKDFSAAIRAMKEQT